MEAGERKTEDSPEAEGEQERAVPEVDEEPSFAFSEKAPAEEEEPLISPETAEASAPPRKTEDFLFEEPTRAERGEGKPARPKSTVRVEKKGLFRYFPLFIVLILLIFGIFYLWSELTLGGRLSSYLEAPMKQGTELWNQIWGLEKEDLTVGDLGRYDEEIGGLPLFIIEGKITNQSKFTKKHIKVRITIYDDEKLKVAEQDAICGRVMNREELKNQPPEFFKGDMVIRPQTEKEMVTPSGKATPFMVIFKDLPSRAKDFKYEILEAPNL
jgi:hypothetical protein